MDDASIIAGLKKGDESAAARLVDIYGNRLLRAAFLLCGDKTEAQDHVQETLVRVVKSAKHCRESSALFPWLYGILLNVHRNHYRKQKLVLDPNEIPEIQIEDLPAGHGLDKQALAGMLLKAINELSPEHREAVILRYYEGLSIKEISSYADLSIGTVNSRLFNGIGRLRKIIKNKMKFLAF
jgi:RNA polymerase sigma-70 factor (ECF subfamily)